jgi:TatD DNase family protein
MFFDTHCHLDMMVLKKEDELLGDEHFVALDQIVSTINNTNICGMISVGASVVGTQNSIVLAQRYKNVFATVGIHPCDCGSEWRKDLGQFDFLLKEADRHKIVAIGEAGLDFFHHPFDKDIQKAAFKEHIELALKYNLPLVIHSREASDETMTILQEYINDGLRGVLHCFSHQSYVAEQFISWGFFLGVGGYVTYPKNNELRAMIENIPFNQLLLETDAPFLPPQQFRGKKNSPSYILLFASVIADIKKVSCQTLAQETTANAWRLFEFKL